MNQTTHPITVVEPSRGWISLRLRDLWEYREILYFLTWRDIKVRYKQTAMGAAWAVIQPFFTMVGVVEGFRWALLGTKTAPGPVVAVSAIVAIALLVGSAFYFRRMERTFADIV